MPEGITGQLLFDALEVGREWADLSSDRQSHYNNIAARLHAQYLASRQETGAITGQALYELFPDCAYTWDRLPLRERHIYNLIAEKLNAQYINPLQGLVRDWQELMQAHDEMSVMSLAEIEGWNKDWEELKKRTREMLKDEQKEG